MRPLRVNTSRQGWRGDRERTEGRNREKRQLAKTSNTTPPNACIQMASDCSGFAFPVDDCSSIDYFLHLRETSVHKQFRSRDKACVIGGKKHDRLADLIGGAQPAEGDIVGDILQALLARF
jgi:hypothetical protein